MSTPSASTLAEAIRQSGEGWLLDYAPQEKAMEEIRQTLNAINKRARERLGSNAPDISETALLEEYHRNPQRVRGFFQALGGTRSPDMLLMAWRVIEGMEVKEVQIGYHRQENFKMQVTLESPDEDKEDAPYESNDINDFKLFRHIGVFKINDSPVFNGFYALRLREP